MLAPTAFSVDQEKGKASAGKEVLVLAPRLHEQVKPNTYVTVIGEVVHADPAEISKKAKPNTPGLPADVIAKYSGRPVILASSVIDGILQRSRRSSFRRPCRRKKRRSTRR